MAPQGGSRRVVVAAVSMMSIAAAVVLLGASGRLSGEPSARTTSAAPSTTASRRSTTTRGLFPYPDDTPNPLQLYPRRPGAKYGDIEARPTAPVSFQFAEVRLLAWSIVPHSALPVGSVPANLSAYSRAGLVDGYAPSTTHDPRDLLRVVFFAAAFGNSAHCVATAGSDGTVLVPYATPSPRAPATTTTTLTDVRASKHTFYLPLGVRRGRLYLTCDVPLIFGGDVRAVWGLDV